MMTEEHTDYGRVEVLVLRKLIVLFLLSKTLDALVIQIDFDFGNHSPTFFTYRFPRNWRISERDMLFRKTSGPQTLYKRRDILPPVYWTPSSLGIHCRLI